MNDGKVALDGTPTEVFSNSEYLESIGLSVPKALELTNALKEKGIDLKAKPLTAEDFVVAFKDYLNN
jgi:hypothetical protein